MYDDDENGFKILKLCEKRKETLICNDLFTISLQISIIENGLV